MNGFPQGAQGKNPNVEVTTSPAGRGHPCHFPIRVSIFCPNAHLQDSDQENLTSRIAVRKHTRQTNKKPNPLNLNRTHNTMGIHHVSESTNDEATMRSQRDPRVTQGRGRIESVVVLFESPLLGKQNPLSPKTQTLGGCETRCSLPLFFSLYFFFSLLGFSQLFDFGAKTLDFDSLCSDSDSDLLGALFFDTASEEPRKISWFDFGTWPPLLIPRIVSFSLVWFCLSCEIPVL